ncbi:uncharacterized protein BT62DRAFT_1013959 [Guyanagaster necrorhizus]|uniref:Uncharacterized protein n=1 Tax=Guyanagaster necrorhizus TaxID=856835 RepID=A0A9P7VF56_9AGAR|nr:uncharacterized protein BT62DRAFT_1013959 [Guyanagaster necrorhizus MCA 3950]KAG7439437.1 hypothetical protein BT62DRAFT_1013959 [Guyanagaster necrorhizus MCA 3950]
MRQLPTGFWACIPSFPERATLLSLPPVSCDADDIEVASMSYAVPRSEWEPVKGMMMSPKFTDILCDSAVVGDMSVGVSWIEPNYDPSFPTSLELEHECNVGLFGL